MANPIDRPSTQSSFIPPHVGKGLEEHYQRELERADKAGDKKTAEAFRKKLAAQKSSNEATAAKEKPNTVGATARADLIAKALQVIDKE